MKIIFDKVVEIYLNDLIDVLYDKEYFGQRASAYDYVGWIIDSIQQNISQMPYKAAPPYFSRYGKDMYYTVFKRSDTTQWYVFFNLEEDVFYIRYIGNNHNCSHHILQE